MAVPSFPFRGFADAPCSFPGPQGAFLPMMVCCVCSEWLEDFDLELLEYFNFNGESLRTSAPSNPLHERFRDSLAGLALWAKRNWVTLDLGGITP